MKKTRFTISLLILTLIAWPSHARPSARQAERKQAAVTQHPDTALLLARDAFRAGDIAKLNRAALSLGGHVLEPYVGYWQLRLRLDERRPDEVLWYLERHAGTLAAEQLRRDWLKVLGKKGEWTLFREQAPMLTGEDAELACYRLAARWQAGEESALAELKPLWLAPRVLPEACMPLAQALLQPSPGRVAAPGEGAPTAPALRWGANELWQRFRILGQANLAAAAKRLLNALAGSQAPDARQLGLAWNSPIKYLERPSHDLTGRPQRELYLLAVSRVARKDPQLAASYWEAKQRERFSAADQSWALGAIATSAARKHMPEALGWFGEITALGGEEQLDDEQLAWRARIALRQGDWQEVRAAIEAMSLPAANEATWTYWLGRAFREQKNELAARAQFKRIAGEHHFYGRLAAEELGVHAALPETAAPPTDAELAAAFNHAGLQRALALYRLGMRTEGMREWLWALRGMDDRALLAASEIASRHEIWDRAINTADRTVAEHDFRLRYMAPHGEILGEAARARALDESLVLALVRQESRFMSFARSGAGASGLMQLMPATAAWVARKMGMSNYAWSRVHLPEINAKLGTFYLRQVLDELDGLPVVAAAAYNAGPGRARRWRDSRPLEGAIYAETIPFNETRDYAKKVMANSIYYAALRGETRSLKARLGMVGSRPGNDRFMAVKETSTP